MLNVVSSIDDYLIDIKEFLLCPTPESWIQAALQNQEILLIDHAHCEKKAASTALNLMYRYVEHYDLLHKMSRLAREELHHFEQAIKILKARNIPYQHLSPSRYAAGMRKHMRTTEPDTLVDVLIIGAFIEARSCERFASLIPHLDPELAQFYQSLLKSESRHYKDYLGLAEQYAEQSIDDRIELFARVEMDLILTPDELFRFHSGAPSID